MQNVKLIFFSLIIALFSSCSDKPTITNVSEPFFDLKTFFIQERDKLKDIKKTIKKASVDGVVEEKTVDSIDLEKELALFVDSDINKIAWQDKYKVDSLFSNNKLSQVDYLAKDDQLKTNQLTVYFNNDDVDSIIIIRRITSLVANIEQHLKYVPSRGYSIKSRQETSLSSVHVLELDVQFIY
jgi:hypothetical protein